MKKKWHSSKQQENFCSLAHRIDLLEETFGILGNKYLPENLSETRLFLQQTSDKYDWSKEIDIGPYFDDQGSEELECAICPCPLCHPTKKDLDLLQNCASSVRQNKFQCQNKMGSQLLSRSKPCEQPLMYKNKTDRVKRFQ